MDLRQGSPCRLPGLASALEPTEGAASPVEIADLYVERDLSTVDDESSAVQHRQVAVLGI